MSSRSFAIAVNFGGYSSPVFLYLTTTGRVSGEPREIEIWFTERDRRFYVIAEQRERAQWVRNLEARPHVTFRVGDVRYEGRARVVHDDREPQLAAAVKRLSEAKYGWSDGLIVELVPSSQADAQ